MNLESIYIGFNPSELEILTEALSFVSDYFSDYEDFPNKDKFDELTRRLCNAYLSVYDCDNILRGGLEK